MEKKKSQLSAAESKPIQPTPEDDRESSYAMAKRKSLVLVVDRWEGPRWIARYIHPDHPKPADAVKPTPMTALERKRKQLGIKPEAMKVGVPALGANMHGDAIILPGAKIHRAETPKDRFHVEQAPSIFGSLALGSYLPSETHLSKVYGG